MKNPRRAFQLPSSVKRIDADLGDEFQFHIDERIEQFMAEGMTREQATSEVHKRFGDYESHRRQARNIDEHARRKHRRMEFLQALLSEGGLALRSLRRSPAFSLIAILTLALGIGTTTALYTVLDAVVLQPLSYAQPDRLISILHPASVPGSGERKWGLSPGGYFWFRNNNRTLADIGVYLNSSATVLSGGEAEVASVARVTASLFPTFRARAVHGRLFNEADDLPNAPRVVVLSYEYFVRRFGGDASIVGKNVQTDAGPREVIGVAQPGLRLPTPGPFEANTDLSGFRVDMWTPLRLDPAGPFYNTHPYVAIARLKDGVTLASAQADLERLFADFPRVMTQAYSPDFISNYKFRVEAADLRTAVLGPTIPRTLWMLLGAVALVLLIAAANVSNLFLVRIEARRRESVMRSALGATTAHLAAHYLAESLLVCVTAAVLGVGLAAVGLRALIAIAPTNIPRLYDTSIGWRSAVIAASIAIALGVIFGVAPLLRRSLDIATLRAGGRGLSPSPAQRALRSSLVTAQIALALVLLAGAGVLLRSFDRLRHVQPGFDGTNVVAFNIELPFLEYDTGDKSRAFHRELLRRIGELPGVASAGITGSVPLEDFGTGCSVVWREGRPYDVGKEPPCASGAGVFPGMFDVLKIRVEGRIPDWSDIDARSHAVVVTGALAKRLWPGESAIGKGIGSNGPNAKAWYRVVGVVPELKAEALDQPPTEAVFYPPMALNEGAGQNGQYNGGNYLVRTRGSDPQALIPALRRTLAGMNAHVPFMHPRLMSDVIARSMARATFLMTLLGIAAAIALILSAVGIYGVNSYVVAQRRGEIGIRVALGASTSNVIGLIVRQSARLAVAGVVIGTCVALLASKLLQSLLFEVSATDPVVLGLVGLGLLTVAVAASVVPARRAARIDPIEAMRSD